MAKLVRPEDFKNRVLMTSRPGRPHGQHPALRGHGLRRDPPPQRRAQPGRVHRRLRARGPAEPPSRLTASRARRGRGGNAADALARDAADPLSAWRDAFHLPDGPAGPTGRRRSTSPGSRWGSSRGRLARPSKPSWTVGRASGVEGWLARRAAVVHVRRLAPRADGPDRRRASARGRDPQHADRQHPPAAHLVLPAGGRATADPGGCAALPVRPARAEQPPRGARAGSGCGPHRGRAARGRGHGPDRRPRRRDRGARRRARAGLPRRRQLRDGPGPRDRTADRRRSRGRGGRRLGPRPRRGQHRARRSTTGASTVAAWCTYKYLNGGPGSLGALFVHERHGRDPSIPRHSGWWGTDPDRRFEMDGPFVPAEGAAGWKASTNPVLALAPLAASLAIFDEVGMPALRARSVAMTGYLEALLEPLLARLGITMITPARRRGAWRPAVAPVRVRGQGRSGAGPPDRARRHRRLPGTGHHPLRPDAALQPLRRAGPPRRDPGRGRLNGLTEGDVSRITDEAAFASTSSNTRRGMNLRGLAIGSIAFVVAGCMANGVGPATADLDAIDRRRPSRGPRSRRFRPLRTRRARMARRSSRGRPRRRHRPRRRRRRRSATPHRAGRIRSRPATPAGAGRPARSSAGSWSGTGAIQPACSTVFRPWRSSTRPGARSGSRRRSPRARRGGDRPPSRAVGTGPQRGSTAWARNGDLPMVQLVWSQLRRVR